MQLFSEITTTGRNSTKHTVVLKMVDWRRKYRLFMNIIGFNIT